MRHASRALVVGSLFLTACTAVDEARMDLLIVIVFVVPLIAFQAVVTWLGYRAEGWTRALAVTFSVIFSLLAVALVATGFYIVLELSREHRSTVLESLFGVVLLGLPPVVMTAYLIDSDAVAVADEDADPEAPMRKRHLVDRTMAVYALLALGALAYIHYG